MTAYGAYRSRRCRGRSLSHRAGRDRARPRRARDCFVANPITWRFAAGV